MTSKEKRQLIYLLNKYQNELLQDVNLSRYNYGKKAQYNHARILANRLSCERESEVIPCYNYDLEECKE